MDTGLRIVLGIIMFTLVAMMIVKEVAKAIASKPAERLANYLTGPILSLLVLFIAIVIISINTILH
jgi:hypothetical protein